LLLLILVVVVVVAVFVFLLKHHELRRDALVALVLFNLKNSLKLLNVCNKLNPKSQASVIFYSQDLTSSASRSSSNASSRDELAKKVSDGGVPLSKEKANAKSEKMSRAMISFLQRSLAQEKIIKEKEADYELGKKYLAKIMAIPENEIDNNAIDKAIAYLLPSSLGNKAARPFMKHPKDYLPKNQEASFDREGRPYHHLFYTSKPCYYDLIDQIVVKLKDLNKIEDTLFDLQRQQNLAPSKRTAITDSKFEMKASEWIKQAEFANIISEKINDEDYARFINSMNRLIEHPLSNREADFILKFCKTRSGTISEIEKNPFLVDVEGVKYQVSHVSQRLATVTVKVQEGNGEIKIQAPEGVFDISFFHEIKHREQLLFPFKIINRINKYDVEMKVNDGGMSCLAKAARLAISRALISFLSIDEIEKLRIAGLLTIDRRLKERKKYGQEGARRKFTWKKR